MNNYVDRVRLEPYINHSIEDVKNDAIDIIDSFETLKEETMVLVIVTKRNNDGTFTAYSCANACKETDEYVFQDAFIKKLIVVR